MANTVTEQAAVVSGERAERGAALKERARGLAGLISANASQTESDRRVPQPVIEAMIDAGLFRVAVPHRLGGAELTVHDMVEINSILGHADGSTAWVSTLTNTCAWLVGLYPDRAQNDVWGADPNTRVCGVLAPSATATRGEGGYTISGKWGFASGSNHSQWAVLGFPVLQDGALVDQGLALISMDDLTIEDTWYVAGMRGTGSNTLVADEVFVPDYRVISIFAALGGTYPTEHKDEALYRSAFVPTLSVVLAGPLTGMASGALDYVLGSLAKGKGISYTFYERAVDSGSTQIAIAQAATLIDTAFLHTWRTTDVIDAQAQAGVYPSLLERGRARMDVGYVTTRTKEAVDLLMTVQGAGGFAEANPLQRMWRDLNVASRHAVINPNIASEAYGRILLGIEEPVTPLL